MAKKSKSKIVIPIIIVLLILAGIGIFFGVQETALDCIGGSTYIITSADVFSRGDLGGKQVIRVIATTSGGGECALINFNKDVLNNQLKDEGYAVTNSKIMSLDIKNQQQIFTFTPSQGDPTSKYYNVNEKNIGKANLCLANSCRENGVNNYLSSYREGTFDLDCLCMNHDAVLGLGGQFSSQFDTVSNVEVSVSDLPSQIVSTSSGNAKVGDRISLKWNGDLLSGSFLSIPNYEGLFLSGKWVMVKKGAFSEVSNNLNTLRNCVDGRDASRTCMNTYLSKLSELIRDKRNEFIQNNNIVKVASITGDKLIVELDRPTRFPQFIIDIDAEWVGIYKLSGQPKVECPADQKVDSGEIANINFRVSNIGEETDSFNVNLVCDGIQQFNTRDSISKGSSKSYSTSITGTNTNLNTIITSSCVLNAQSVGSSAKDECKFDLDVEGVSGCSRDLCEGNNLIQCVNGEPKTLSCELGCEFKNGLAQCREKQSSEICNNGLDDDADGLIDEKDPDCKPVVSQCQDVLSLPQFLGSLTIVPNLSEECLSRFTGFLDKAQFFIAIVSFLIVSFATYLLFKKKKILTDKKGNLKIWAWIWVILFGFLSHLLIQNFLWVGLGIFILYLIISFSIKGVKGRVGL